MMDLKLAPAWYGPNKELPVLNVSALLAGSQGCYNKVVMGTRGFDRSVLGQIASRGAIALVNPVANK